MYYLLTNADFFQLFAKVCTHFLCILQLILFPSFVFKNNLMFDGTIILSVAGKNLHNNESVAIKLVTVLLLNLLYYYVGTACTVTVRCLSVPFAHCGGFAAVGPADRRYRSIAARPAQCCSSTRPQHGTQQQMRAVLCLQLT